MQFGPDSFYSNFCSNAVFPLAWLTVLRLLLLGPVLEEWIIRAGLQHQLMRWSGRDRRRQAAVVLLAALAFSLLHLRSGYLSASLVFVPGLLLGLLYLWKKDWRICALVHSFFNSVFLNLCFFI